MEYNGFRAFNTDDISGVTELENKITGEVIDWPKGKVDWSTYAWNWQCPAIENLLSRDETVFLGSVVSNQMDFYDLFDKMLALTVSAEMLAQRLDTYEHHSHHLPGEIERILTDHDQKNKRSSTRAVFQKTLIVRKSRQYMTFFILLALMDRSRIFWSVIRYDKQSSLDNVRFP